MELMNQRLAKRIGSALLLTGMMVVSVLWTQPQPATGSGSDAAKKPASQAGSVRNTGISSRGTLPVRTVNTVRPNKDFKYTVQEGDTLYDLAIRYQISVEEIMAASGLTGDKLALDQELIIPVPGKYKVVPVAAKPETKKKAVKTASAANRKTTTYVSRRFSGKAVGSLVPWSSVHTMFPNGTVVTVIDVNTGYTMQIKRKFGHNHADCEPLTAGDTATMKSLFGGSWSWDRRAVVVIIKGQKIAASMAGMPHGTKSIKGNNFNGHFDLHFYGSKTHGSSYTKSRTAGIDPAHQAMVRKAAGR